MAIQYNDSNTLAPKRFHIPDVFAEALQRDLSQAGLRSRDAVWDDVWQVSLVQVPEEFAPNEDHAGQHGMSPFSMDSQPPRRLN